VLPLRHRLRVVGWQQTAAHEAAQQPPAHACLHLRDGGGIKAGGGTKDDPARGGLEHAVDDRSVKVQVRIAETVAAASCTPSDARAPEQPACAGCDVRDFRTFIDPSA